MNKIILIYGENKIRRNNLRNTVRRKVLSLFLTLIMLCTLMPATSFAAAQPTFTMNVLGKDGKSLVWSETWYFQDGTKDKSYLDASFTKNQDGSGGELSILNTFNDEYFAKHPEYSYFDDYDAFIYTGGRFGNTARVGVVKKGILMDDIISYVEQQSGFSNLLGKTCVQMTAGSDNKVWPYEDISKCAFEDYYWGEERYYFKGMAEKAPEQGRYGIWFSDDAMSMMTDENRIPVPYVFAMVGYGGDGMSLQTALDSADTYMSLRSYMGTTNKNKEDFDKSKADGTPDFGMNLGNPSAQNINTINFYPVYNSIAVKNGTESGTEGSDGYQFASAHAVVTSYDNYFKAATGETVTLKVLSDDSTTRPYTTLTITDSETGDNVSIKRNNNNFTFTMPAHAVIAEISASAEPSAEDKEFNISTVVEPASAGLLKVSDGSDTASAGSTVDLTVDTFGCYKAEKIEYSQDNGTTWIEISNSNGRLSFTMPESDVQVRAILNGELTIYEVDHPGAAAEKKDALKYDKISNLDEKEDFYYGGFSSRPAAFEGKASVSIDLQTLLSKAGVEFSNGDTIIFHTSSGEDITLTYDELYSESRFYFPALYTGKNWEARSNGKISILPHIIMKGSCLECSENADIANSDVTAANTPSLGFGLSMDEFSKNSDASPSSGSLTSLIERLTYIENITVEHSLNYDISWYTGHENDTSYIINTEAELRGFAAIVDGTALDETYNSIFQDSFNGKTVTLGADIRLHGKWDPAGDDTHVFDGIFDGCNKTISDMNITDCSSGYKGFFANVTGTVKNLIVSGNIGTENEPVTSGSDNLGGIAGFNNGHILNVSSDVSINVKTAAIYAIGGIVGQNGENGIIENCSNTAYLQGTKCTGGIAGRSFGKISKCFNTGSITGNGGGKDGIGGIVGLAGNKSSAYQNSIVSCYNEGSISNDNGRWFGGIAGMADSATTVKNCFNTGKISNGYSWNWNPIIGHIDGAYSTVCNNYSLFGTSAGDTSDTTKPLTIGTVKTAEEIRTSDFITLLGSDYKSDEGCFPILSWQNTDGHKWNSGVITSKPTASVPGSRLFTCERCLLEKNESIPASGDKLLDGLDIKSTVWDGISIDISWYSANENKSVYTIDTAAKLAGAAALVNGIVNNNCMIYDGEQVFSADKWNDSEFVNNGTGTHGECNRATDDYSYGIENFNGKTLKLTADIDMSAGNYMPLGGQYRMDVKNPNSQIGSSFCGIFDGNGHYVTLLCDRYCGSDYGDGESIGLIGRIGIHDNESADMRPSNAAVFNVAVKGSIKGNRSIGGIVGKIGKTAEGAIISGCANYASIWGSDAKGTGGICGSAWNGGVIENCYNSASVTNSHNSYGGIAGSNEILLKNCYNTGYISGAGTSAAIATAHGGTYENCYWLSTSADIGVYNISDDQVLMKTSSEMKDKAFISALGSEFAEDSNGINNGYPILKWQIREQSSSSGGSGNGGSSSSGGNGNIDSGSHSDTTPTLNSKVSYNDVKTSDWFYDAVIYTSDKKLMDGVGNDKFAPEGYVTRAMAITILYRLEGTPAVGSTISFDDIKYDMWYSDAVKWGSDNGITLGYGNNRFAPDNNVTREQLVSMIYRYAKMKNADVSSFNNISLDSFTDKKDISGYAQDAFSWAVRNNIIKGLDSYAKPRNNATRAQMAQIIMNFQENLLAAK